MTRTQVYLPSDIHNNLLMLAKKEKTTLSDLIREGAEHIVKKRSLVKNKKQRALAFFSNPPESVKIKKTGKQLISLMRRERED